MLGDTSSSRSWPRITIITPSFNQGEFIEEAIRSILLQGYPNLEYFVLDGGSTDSTVEIISKYSQWIDFWVSEPDGGQSAAINRGFRMGSGTYVTWINSDDMLCKDALWSHLSSNTFAPGIVYVGDCLHINEAGTPLFTHRGSVRTVEDFLRVRSVWRCDGSIDQPAVLFPLELALRVGGLNEANHYTMDYELWGRFLLAGAQFHYTGLPFGYFRWHDGQKTLDAVAQTESMLDVAAGMIPLAHSLPNERRQELLADLGAYRKEYPQILWKHSGRLARAGLPRSVVVSVRKLRRAFGMAIDNSVKAIQGFR
jgi:glycosyltransferase involved in cell wall biosynthesis